MKIFILGPFYPLRGGIAQYIGVLGKKLIERGHQVKVLSFRKQFPKFFFPGRTQLETSQERIILDSQAVFTPWNLLSWWRTFRAARDQKPDILIVKYWMPFFAPGFAVVCFLLKRFTSIRITYILDNVIPHERRFGDRLLTRLAFRWVDSFIVQSEVVKSDLINWFPPAQGRKILFAPHPLYDCYSRMDISRESALKELALNPNCKHLLFFGLVRQYKGLDILIRALPRIVEGLEKKVHLTIAGEFYDSENKYRAIITNLKLDDFVTIVNEYVPNERVGLYFRAADLLVTPYKSATQSGVIQIAFNYELPVVTTKVGGLPEVIQEGETGFLVDPERPDLIAETVLRYFREEFGEKMRGNMAREKEHFSWNALLEQIESS